MNHSHTPYEPASDYLITSYNTIGGSPTRSTPYHSSNEASSHSYLDPTISAHYPHHRRWSQPSTLHHYTSSAPSSTSHDLSHHYSITPCEGPRIKTERYEHFDPPLSSHYSSHSTYDGESVHNQSSWALFGPAGGGSSPEAGQFAHGPSDPLLHHSEQQYYYDHAFINSTNSPAYPSPLIPSPSSAVAGHPFAFLPPHELIDAPPISSHLPSSQDYSTYAPGYPSSTRRMSLASNLTPSPPPSRPCSEPSTKSCSHCRTTTTPLWRREPTTMRLLCNACGLYLQQHHRLRPQELIDADSPIDEDEEGPAPPGSPQCSHCKTRVTTVWRRNKQKELVCNACGVYQRMRGKERPLPAKRKRIKPRPKVVDLPPVI